MTDLAAHRRKLTRETMLSRDNEPNANRGHRGAAETTPSMP